MKNFRDLMVWQKSHALALSIYQVTREFPKGELYGLTSQLRRSAVSIPANIAEGCGRGSDADLGRFLQMAMGSACEVEYHLLLANDLEYLSPDAFQDCNNKVCEVKRMLASFLQKLKADR